MRGRSVWLRNKLGQLVWAPVRGRTYRIADMGESVSLVVDDVKAWGRTVQGLGLYASFYEAKTHAERLEGRDVDAAVGT
jgi:hypothetical protein